MKSQNTMTAQGEDVKSEPTFGTSTLALVRTDADGMTRFKEKLVVDK